MRDAKAIEEYWDMVHIMKNMGGLSGCGYEETINFLQIADILKEGDCVLEIGVGVGYVTEGFKAHGFKISALDISKVALGVVRDFCENTYTIDDIEKMPSDYFDVIICHNVIQHIPTFLLEKELPHIIRAMKPTGVFALEFVSTNLIEDTGVDSPILEKLGWDDNIGCYCRTPEVLEKIINTLGGTCKLIQNAHGEFAENINGCHIFHVTKQ